MNSIAVIFFGSSAVGIAAQCFRQMGVKRASGMNIHELHAATDAQACEVRAIDPMEQDGLKRVSLLVNGST